MNDTLIAFIGGGNMATAIITGLLKGGRPADALLVVEPNEAQRNRLETDFGVRTLAAADPALGEATLVVWAVKPQMFLTAAAAYAPHVGQALQLSVMAGVRSSAIARVTGTDRVVRAMPNTPALIGLGMTGLYASPGITADERDAVERLLAATGQTLWVQDEPALDALTAVSGSGPAYVFYLIEAMAQAAVELGLSPADGQRLAIATAVGAAGLAQASPDSPEVLRQRVTSKGGTTHAAVSQFDAADLRGTVLAAMRAAQRRAVEMGDEFGG